MTIQEIRDLIAKKITGQGTQCDLGNGLPAILNGILDAVEGASMEPLIVRGSLSEGDAEKEFTPDADQPSFGDALTAYQSGVPVFLVYIDKGSESELTDLVTSFSNMQGGDQFDLITRYTKWSVGTY